MLRKVFIYLLLFSFFVFSKSYLVKLKKVQELYNVDPYLKIVYQQVDKAKKDISYTKENKKPYLDTTLTLVRQSSNEMAKTMPMLPPNYDSSWNKNFEVRQLFLVLPINKNLSLAVDLKKKDYEIEKEKVKDEKTSRLVFFLNQVLNQYLLEQKEKVVLQKIKFYKRLRKDVYVKVKVGSDVKTSLDRIDVMLSSAYLEQEVVKQNINKIFGLYFSFGAIYPDFKFSIEKLRNFFYKKYSKLIKEIDKKNFRAICNLNIPSLNIARLNVEKIKVLKKVKDNPLNIVLKAGYGNNSYEDANFKAYLILQKKFSNKDNKKNALNDVLLNIASDNLDLQEKIIFANLLSTLSSIRSLEKQLKVVKKQFVLAKKVLSDTKKLYKHGEVNLTTVLDVETKEHESNLKVLETEVLLFKQYLKFFQILGDDSFKEVI